MPVFLTDDLKKKGYKVKQGVVPQYPEAGFIINSRYKKIPFDAEHIIYSNDSLLCFNTELEFVADILFSFEGDYSATWEDIRECEDYIRGELTFQGFTLIE